MKTILATIACLAISGGAAMASPVGTTGNVTPDVIWGSGNANGSFTGVQSNGLELALRGKLRYDTSGFPENTFNYNGVDTYVFSVAEGNAPANRSVFNFEWSINSDFDGTGDSLNAYTYLIGVDTDPTSLVNAVTYDPLSPISTGAYFGTNTNGNGGAPFTANTNPQTTFDGLAETNNVAQNSVNLGFLGLFPDPQLQGLFTISLSAFDPTNNSVVARTSIDVQYGEVPPVPLPAALPLLLGGMAALYGLSRRRRTDAA